MDFEITTHFVVIFVLNQESRVKEINNNNNNLLQSLFAKTTNSIYMKVG
jgi:hypothetical protein